jgi:hypothetical protein
VSELIAIPLESDRHAVELLAALRRLQAEYRADSGGTGASATGDDVLTVTRPGRRLVWWRLRSAALAVLVGGAIGGLTVAAAAVCGEAPAPGTPLVGGVPEAPMGRGVGVGGLLAAVGATFAILLLRLHRAEPARTRAAPTVTRLVAYLVRDGSSLEARRVRVSSFRIASPAEAEGRPEAVPARADATAAR